MTTVKKKVTRKELLKEPDEFLSLSRRIFNQVILYKAHAAIALAVIISAVLVYSLVNYFSERRETQAFSRLKQASEAYQTSLARGGPKEAYASVGTSFKTLIEDYSGRSAGRLAIVLYAGMAYDAGDFESAKNLYEKALQNLETYPSMAPVILNGIAHAYEQTKDYPKAISYFEKIAGGEGLLMKDEAIFNLGLIYADTGDTEKSKASFQRIVSEFPDSLYLEIAREKLRILSS